MACIASGPSPGVMKLSCAALHNRRAAGADTVQKYLEIAVDRVKLAVERRLPRRPIDRPVYVPKSSDRIAQMPLELASSKQALLRASIGE